jgi:hypothetical protein
VRGGGPITDLQRLRSGWSSATGLGSASWSLTFLAFSCSILLQVKEELNFLLRNGTSWIAKLVKVRITQEYEIEANDGYKKPDFLQKVVAKEVGLVRWQGAGLAHPALLVLALKIAGLSREA